MSEIFANALFFGFVVGVSVFGFVFGLLLLLDAFIESDPLTAKHPRISAGLLLMGVSLPSAQLWFNIHLTGVASWIGVALIFLAVLVWLLGDAYYRYRLNNYLAKFAPPRR